MERFTSDYIQYVLSIMTHMKLIKFVVIASVCLCLLFDFVKLSPILLAEAQSEAQNSFTEISNGSIKQVVLFALDAVVRLSPDNQLKPGGILYEAMTFNGTVPGPWISINQGDVLEITLVNQADAVHSLDLHAAYGASQALSGSIEPGQNKTLRMKAAYPGVFMYHCDGDNLNGIWEHVANGMYGGIIVHAKNENSAKEFHMIFSEIFNSADKGFFRGTEGKIGSFDFNKFIANKPDLILTNGMAYKYIPSFGSHAKIQLNMDAQIFNVRPGELTRWYVINAGPRGNVAFNFAGGLINENPISISNSSSNFSENHKSNSQSKIYEISIPPGSGNAIEAIFPEEGTYFGNDHDLARVLAGAGFVVLASRNSTSEVHPSGALHG
jgi:nitrite reductase (NO-forming)